MAISVIGGAAPAARYERTDRITSTQSWTAPADVTRVEIILCGGGGGGSEIASSSIGGGGGGGSVDYSVLTVTPLTAYTITIGAGGAGRQNSLGGTGFDGGSSSFGALLTIGGGGGGGITSPSTAHNIGGLRAGLGGDGGGGLSYQSATGTFSPTQSGGPGAHNLGGGGGGGIADNFRFEIAPGNAVNGGGRGGDARNLGGLNGVANTGGGGGGGRGANNPSGSIRNGGNGGSGVAIIKYWSAL